MILNAISGAGGGSSGFEVVASETITTTSYYLYMNIPLTDYAVGDILYIKLQGTPSGNSIFKRVCCSIGKSWYSEYIETAGLCWLGSDDGSYAYMLGYFSSSDRNLPIISKDSDSVTYITATSYHFEGTYDIVLLRPTA